MDARTDSVAQLLLSSKQTSACKFVIQGFLKVQERESSTCGNTLVDGHSHAVRPPISPHMTLENPEQRSLDGNMPAAGHNESHPPNLGQIMSFLTCTNTDDKFHYFTLILRRCNTKS